MYVNFNFNNFKVLIHVYLARLGTEFVSSVLSIIDLIKSIRWKLLSDTIEQKITVLYGHEIFENVALRTGRMNFISRKYFFKLNKM